MILCVVKFKSGNKVRKAVSAFQWVEQDCPFSNPVAANRNAPVHKLATSAPFLYCVVTQFSASLLLLIAKLSLVSKLGKMITSVFLIAVTCCRPCNEKETFNNFCCRF